MIVALPTNPAVLNHPEHQTRYYVIETKRPSLYASHNGRAFKFWTNYLTLSSQHLPGADAKYIAIPPEFRVDTRTAAVGFVQATAVTTFMN